MKTFMTWDRMAIGIERTSDASFGRATVQSENRVVQQRLARVFGDGTKKMYRSHPTVMSGLQACVQKVTILLWSFGSRRLSLQVVRRGA